MRARRLHGASEKPQTNLWPCRTATLVSCDAFVNEVIRAAADLEALCHAHAWRFCFIGGVAVQRWGEPRETVDVDATLLRAFATRAVG
jgi:hypothetical protein